MTKSPLKIVKNQTIIFTKLILIIDKNIRKIKKRKEEEGEGKEKGREGEGRRKGEQERRDENRRIHIKN